MNFWQNIVYTFKQGSAPVKLIYVNASIFLLIKALGIILQLFNIQSFSLLYWIALPSDFSLFIRHLWTIITYMFVHEGFFHIFFNMLCLYWFGKMFLFSFSPRNLIGLYLTGGVFAGLFYILVYNIFPYFEPFVYNSILLGASGSIMAIIIATATRMPNMEIRLFFIGGIKLKYIAVVTVLISFFGITSSNSGGEIAHLGGALFGYLFVVLYNRGTDITAWMNTLLDGVNNLFCPKHLKVKKKKTKVNYERKMTDAEYNMQKAKNMEEIDRILDKIKESGYQSLSEEEKKRLFDQSKNP